MGNKHDDFQKVGALIGVVENLIKNATSVMVDIEFECAKKMITMERVDVVIAMHYDEYGSRWETIKRMVKIINKKIIQDAVLKRDPNSLLAAHSTYMPPVTIVFEPWNPIDIGTKVLLEAEIRVDIEDEDKL